MANKPIKSRFIFLVIFSLVLVVLWLNSTTWFRLKMAGLYQNRKAQSKAAAIYEKILRKETIRHALSPSLKGVIFPQLKANYSDRIKYHFENAKGFLSVNNINKAQEEYQEIADLTKRCEYLYNSYLLPIYKEKRMEEIITEAHFNLGKLFFAKNEFDPYPYFKRVAEINPEYKDTYSIFLASFDERKRFGLFLLNVGLNKAAIQQFQILARQKPRDALIHYYLASLLKEDGKWDDAIKEFKEAVSLFKNLEIVRMDKRILNCLACSLYYLGLDFERKGDIDKGIEYYETALKADEQIIDCYYRLKSIYEKSGRMEEANLMELKLLHLEPMYKLKYKLNENLTLFGYSLNELELEAKQSFQITFFWETSRQKPELSYEKGELSNIYKIGNRLYEVKEIKNLASNSGFEIDSIGKGFPYGWKSDIYGASSENHEIVSELMPLGEGQCLLLNNSRAPNTNCQTDYIVVDSNSPYLQTGWVKTADGNAFLGRIWLSSGQDAIKYNYVAVNIRSPDWKYYSEVIIPPSNSAYCRLWLINYETQGKAYFDGVLFIKLQSPF